MKKTLIALTALAALAAGTAATTTAAQAKIHVDLHLGGGFYAPGYYGPGYYDSGYYDSGYDDYSDCGYVTVKKVKWINGHKYVSWKKKLVCN
jgi:hypothetical protein